MLISVESLQEGDDSDVFISFEVETLNFPAKVGIKSGYQVRFTFEGFFPLLFSFELAVCHRHIFSTWMAANPETVESPKPIATL